jgi:nucleotide-binding universal stress UspA family protein
MLPIHTILHPTDFSTHSEYAFQLAVALARDYKAHLIVLHVEVVPAAIYGFGEGILPPRTEWDDELRRELEHIQAADPSVHLTHRLEEGDPVTQILNVAKETNADLIVIGTHGRRGIPRLLMGSVAEQVVRQANRPVLSVRAPFPETVLAEAAIGAAVESTVPPV